MGCAASVDVQTTDVQPLAPVTTKTTTTAPAATSPASTSPATTAPDATDVLEGAADKKARPYDEALSAAVVDIQAYWRTTFPQVYGMSYTDVKGGIWPVQPGVVGVPGCGEPRTSFGDIEGNAFYCPQGDFMAYDDQELFPTIYERYGSDVLAMILAHEWGHAIQVRAGIDGSTILLEQQADCFSGAWMGHLAADGGPITVNDDTLTVAVAGMVSFSDAPGTTTKQDGAHGSGFDRVGAFQDGFDGGAAQCATYTTNPPQVLELPLTESDFATGGNLPYDTIVPLTIKDLDRFWTHVFAGRGVTYAAPAGGLQPYPAAGPYPSCPGITAGDAFYQGRVWYCPEGDFIAYDTDALGGTVYDIGDFAVSVLVGNAWSDAMQSRLGVTETGRDRSLDGDCLTGAWTRSTLPGPDGDPDKNLTLSAGDLDEGVIAFLRFGAGEGGGVQVGTVFDRVSSFRRGILQGVTACGIA